MAYTTIDDPEAYFQVKAYTGDGNDPHALTLDGETDMQPNLLWLKSRDSTGAHFVVDSVRGASVWLRTNVENPEQDDDAVIVSLNSDGFSVGDDLDSNANTEKFVGWCWKESATAGFDIISYSGTGSAKTESHSLSAVPHWMLVKQRTDPGGGSNSWEVYHQKNTSAPETEFMYLNEDQATTDSNLRWNDTAPTSSVITVGTGNSTNQSGTTYIGYLWSEKQGFSKFGSYTGNGNADGPFVYTGFRPAWIMVRDTGNAAAWMIMDNKRSGYNPTNNRLYAHASSAEESAVDRFDFLSNGFKIRTGDADTNCDGCNFIYMAFAEQPLVNSEGVPCNAR